MDEVGVIASCWRTRAVAPSVRRARRRRAVHAGRSRRADPSPTTSSDFSRNRPTTPASSWVSFGQDPLQFEEHGYGQALLDMPRARTPFRGSCSRSSSRSGPVARGPIGAISLATSPGRRGTLELARGDGLLDQRAHQVPVPGTGVGDIDGELDPPVLGIAIDLVQHAVQIPGIGIRKGPALLVVEREGMAVRRSRQLDRQPPLLVREPRRAARGAVEMDQCKYLFFGRIPDSRFIQGEDLLKPPLLQQLGKRRRAWVGSFIGGDRGRATGPKCKLYTNLYQISISRLGGAPARSRMPEAHRHQVQI